MEDITTQINDHRRDVENLQMLTTIQRQLDGLDVCIVITLSYSIQIYLSYFIRLNLQNQEDILNGKVLY